MDQLNHIKSIFFLNFSLLTVASGATFTFVNKCDNTVWPGILANAGSPKLQTTGFELPSATSRTFQAPSGWSGRFWGRTGCNFGDSGLGYCTTGDCGSGTVECDGAGAEPPATLAEFTLGTGGQDFYDVSLVDGYNLPMLVEVSGGSGLCASTGCIVDLNRVCPTELKAGNGDACKSACEAFGSPEYCCSGAYGSPTTCRPTVYSQMFKSACPRSYSYAYDDATSTFTCSGADYTITFCPSTPSQKSTRDTPTPVTTPVTATQPDLSGSNPMGSTASGFGGDMTYGSASESDPGMLTGTGTGTGRETTAMLSDGSWLAGLAMGGSPSLEPTFVVILISAIFSLLVISLL
ncbi:thaumatin-like protein 1 [Amaranthus tricolor]|uniref:thaumatin-like protein 1 n=1 Tax=Amaranthus tricolor TaxID=29722 RepID=UPI00258B832A|nr:thaumatin-like protein 1 [Amaranthus tricolor]